MANANDNISEQLLRYLDGELSPAEWSAMEELIATDERVRSEWESLLQTKAAIRHFGLEQQVGSIHKEMMKELKPPLRSISTAKRVLRYSMAVAASIVLIVSGILIYNFISLSSGKVYASHYKTYELSTTRDGEKQETATEKAYRERNYKEVIRIHDKREDRSIKGEFLCGVAAMEMNDNSKAIKCFNEVLHMNRRASSDQLTDEAEYYLALAYIGNKDYDFALPILRKIKDETSHTYHASVSTRMIRQVKLLKWR
jgi:tetratricopeptide (TPR) repeat protein